MKSTDAFELVWSTFINNRMRTLLTILGVSIGMGAIVFLVSLGLGLQKLTIDRIAHSEALLTLSLTSGNSNIVNIDAGKVEEIKKTPGVDFVGLSYAFTGHMVKDKTETDATIYAVDNNFLNLESIVTVAGREYSDEQSAKTLMISKSAASALGFTNPDEALDKEISVTAYYSDLDRNKKDELKLKVSAVTSEDTSNVIYLPISKLNVPADTQYSIVKAKLHGAEVAKQTTSSLEQLGLKVYSVTELINSMNKVFRIIQLVMLGFGLIALIVASLGMFNTLTVSLLERTREIGILKALGATDADIYRIFLLESLLMGFSGGLGGVALGYLIGTTLNLIISQMAVKLGGESVQLFYTPWYLVAAVFIFSVLVGFLTGFYPSRRAAKLNPLDTLRYE